MQCLFQLQLMFIDNALDVPHFIACLGWSDAMVSIGIN